jgi:hypothetical protein
MIKTFKVILMTALVLYAGLSTAGEKKATPRSIETLMIKSGLSKQLEQLPPMLQAGMAQQNQGPKALSPEQINELSGLAASAFDAKVLKENVQKHLQANLSETEAQAALAWLSSPLGEKITKLEEDGATPAAYVEMQKMAGSLTKNAGRVELTRKLDKAVKGTETGVAVALNIQTAMIAALTSEAAPEMRPTMENIEKEMIKNKGQIQSAIEQGTLLSFLYIYRRLSDAEIAKYIDFANSASGKKYHSVTFEGLNAAMTNAAHVLGSLIAHDASKKEPGAAKQQNI